MKKTLAQIRGESALRLRGSTRFCPSLFGSSRLSLRHLVGLITGPSVHLNEEVYVCCLFCSGFRSRVVFCGALLRRLSTVAISLCRFAGRVLVPVHALFV